MNNKELLDLIEELCTGIAGTFGQLPNPVAGQSPSLQKHSRHREKRAQLGYPYLKLRKKNNK